MFKAWLGELWSGLKRGAWFLLKKYGIAFGVGYAAGAGWVGLLWAWLGK